MHKTRSLLGKAALLLATLAISPVPAAEITAKPITPQAVEGSLADRVIQQRAFEAVIWGMPAINTDLMRQEMLDKTRAKVNEVVYWGQPMQWKNQTLTPNPDAIYFMTFFDTKDGPIVFDLPAGDAHGSFNGNIVTVWQMPLEDAGLLGLDKGAGAKYLVLPPGYDGARPEGYVPLQSDTFSGFILFRANFASHSDADVAKAITYGKQMKVYPLAQAASPTPTVFTDAKDVLFDSTLHFDASLFGHLNRVVQAEPWLQRDRAMIDSLRTLGMEKGKPFSPDAHTTALLEAGAREAGEYLEALYDKGWGTFFDSAGWRPAGAAEVIKAQATAYGDVGAYPVDLRGMTYTYGFVGIKRLGAGQFYLIAIHDDKGAALDGGKTYRLHVPANVPMDQYWSVTVYDRKTHALVRNMASASRSSQLVDLQKEPDGAVDIYFGAKAPAGKESNWVPTDPQREFELMFRLYGPKKEFFDKVWVLPDPKLVSEM